MQKYLYDFPSTITKEDVKNIRAILESKADVNVEDCMVMRNLVSTEPWNANAQSFLETLLEFKANITPFVFGHTRTSECAKELVKHLPTINDNEQISILSQIAVNSRADVALVLIRAGANVNECDGEPLRLAIQWGYINMVKVFLSHGGASSLWLCMDEYRPEEMVGIHIRAGFAGTYDQEVFKYVLSGVEKFGRPPSREISNLII
jgi:hypothetical protein